MNEIECTHCGSDVGAHQPVFLSEREDAKRVPVGVFCNYCNYACPSAYIDSEELIDGNARSFDP